MKNKGFSFVELLVAVAILGIISLPIVSSFALAAKMDAKATHLSSMNDAADDVLLLLEEAANDYKISEGSTEPLITLVDGFRSRFKNIIAENNAPVQSEEDGNSQIDSWEFQYNGYTVTVSLKSVSENYYRADITVRCSVSGDTLEVNRKGLLSYA